MSCWIIVARRTSGEGQLLSDGGDAFPVPCSIQGWSKVGFRKRTGGSRGKEGGKVTKSATGRPEERQNGISRQLRSLSGTVHPGNIVKTSLMS